MKKYRVDTEVDGKRLVDEVVFLEDKKHERSLCYSPILMANVLFRNRDLKEVKE